MEEKIQRYWLLFITKVILLITSTSVHSCQKLIQDKDYEITKIVIRTDSSYMKGISTVDTIFISKNRPPESYSVVGAEYIWDGKYVFVDQIIINYDSGMKPNIVFNMAEPFYMESYKIGSMSFEGQIKLIVKTKFSSKIYFRDGSHLRLFPNNETEIVINDYYPPAPPLEE